MFQDYIFKVGQQVHPELAILQEFSILDVVWTLMSPDPIMWSKAEEIWYLSDKIKHISACPGKNYMPMSSAGDEKERYDQCLKELGKDCEGFCLLQRELTILLKDRSPLDQVISF